MGRFAIGLLEPGTGAGADQPEGCHRLRIELNDPNVLEEVAARIGVLYPHFDRVVTDTAIEITVPSEEAGELAQTVSDLVLRVRLSQRDAPLRARLYARLLE